MNNANEEKKSLREDLGKRETVDNARVGRNIVWSVVGLGVFAAGYFAYNYITKPEDIQVVEQTQRPIVYPGPDTNIVRTIRPKIASEDTTGGYVRLPSKDYGRLQKNSQRAEELERETLVSIKSGSIFKTDCPPVKEWLLELLETKK